jgi:hypothetical protein
MSQVLNIGMETAKTVKDFGIKALHYQGYMCSCVGANDGTPDPTDDCYNGWRYKAAVEYQLMRTSVSFKYLDQKASTILQGGCTLTIPQKQDEHHAVITGLNDLSAGVDLSSKINIKISIDGAAAVEIDCSNLAATAASSKLSEIIKEINAAGFGEIAYESGSDGDPTGSGYLTLRSVVIGTGSVINILVPSANDATNLLLGLNPALYPFQYRPQKGVFAFLPIHSTIGRNDVVIIDGRTRRDGERLKRGVRDTLKAFDIQKIIKVSAKGVDYIEGIDFNMVGMVVTWIESKGPADQAAYVVDYLTKANYVLFDDMPTDRGSDVDNISKRVLMALRHHIELGSAQALPIDSL